LSVDDATLIVTLRDETSGPANRITAALEKFNTQTSLGNKETQSLERTAAKLATGLGALTGSTQTSAAAMVGASRAAAGYEAQLKRINGIQINSAGKAINPAGQFISNAELDQALVKARALQAIQSGAGIKSSGSFLNTNNEIQNVSSGANAGKVALNDLTASASRTRFALYAVAQAARTIGLGLLAIPIASAVLATAYERDFATVERATLVAGAQAKALKSSLIDLSTQVPISFKAITNIAAAGAQLGIDPSGLVNFTRVVAMLTATTNLSAEAAQNFLGKFKVIAGVDPKNFNNLASTILNVGVHTAATEMQIAKLGTQIVGIGKQAGFTVPQIVGIAGALASVSSVGVELGRGTLTQFVTKMQLAVESGGPALEAFAKTAGVSAATVQNAFGTDKFAGVFTKFFEGLDKVQKSGGNANAILAEIGVTSIRQVPLLLNLASGWKVLRSSIDLANAGWNDTTILTQHYAKINDTLVSKLIELGNTFGKFLNQVGSASTGPLKDVTKSLTDMVGGLIAFGSTNAGQNALIWAAGLAVALGVLLLMSAALANIVGGVLAANVAYTGLTAALVRFDAAQAASAAASITGMSKFQRFAAFMTGPWGLAMIAATVGLTLLTDQLDRVHNVDMSKLTNKIVTGASGGAILGAAGSAQTGRFVGDTTKDLGHLSTVLKAAADQSSNLFARFDQTHFGAFSALRDIGDQLGKLAQSDLPAAQNGFAQLAGKTDGTKQELWRLISSMPAYRDELIRQLNVSKDTINEQNILKLAYGGVGDGMLSTAGKARVLTDEIKRQRDFQTGLLEVTGLTQKNIDDYGASYQKSISPLTDFNSVVKQVQDGLQAAATQQAALSAGKDNAKTYYDGVSVSLAQFTAQLEANNATQATWFQNVITVAAQYGTAAADIFIRAGYTATSASILQQLVDATPAQAAAYIAAQTTAAETAAVATGEALISAGQLHVVGSGARVGQDTARQIGQMLLAGFSPADIMKHFNLEFGANPATPKANIDPAKNEIIRLTSIPYPSVTIAVIANLSAFQRAVANAQIQANIYASGKGYASGGFTGYGTKYQPTGIVHAGEFVFPQEAVNRIGIPQLYAMMRNSRGATSAPRMSYAEGGMVGAGNFTALDAQSLQAIMALANRPIFLYTTDRVIAETAARGNTEIAYGGQN
jgi:TP901 family phage tail tape measure protein